MLTFFSVSSAATNHYLLVSESQSCTTELSDLQGNCSMMYTWNGTFFVDFPSIDWPLSSTGGQELPAADAHVLFQDQNNQQKPAILLSYTFAQDKPRTPFQETGPRSFISRNVNLTQYFSFTFNLEFLGAPSSLVYQEKFALGDSTYPPRLLVLSHHFQKILIFDSCNTTGKLIPNQENAAVNANGEEGSFCGAFSMQLNTEHNGCLGDANASACLYVLHMGCSNNPGSSTAGVVFFELNLTSGLLTFKRIHSSSVVNGLSVFQFSSVASHAYVASLTYGGLSVMKYHEDQANMDIIEFLTSHAKVPWEFSRNLPLRGVTRPYLSMSQSDVINRNFTITSASRIFGDYDISVYQTETFTDQTDTFLVVAAGKSGVFLLRWDETNERIELLQNLVKPNGEKDSNAVGLTLCNVTGEGLFVVVLNYVSDVKWTGINVYQFNPAENRFSYHHTLASSPSWSGWPSYSRSAAFFSIQTSDNILMEFLAVAYNQDTTNKLFPSILYKWEQNTSRFDIYSKQDQFFIPGASTVLHTKVKTAASTKDLLIFSSLYSFSGGCSPKVNDMVVECEGVRQIQTTTSIFCWEQDLTFKLCDTISSQSVSSLQTFEMPCAQTSCTTTRKYLLITERYSDMSLFSGITGFTITDNSLVGFHVPKLYLWSETSQTFHQLPAAFQLVNGTIPAEPPADPCVNLASQTEWGPCTSYMPGGFNDGFCVLDDACDVCQLFCHSACHQNPANSACLSYLQLGYAELEQKLSRYERMLARRWPSAGPLDGLSAPVSFLHFQLDGEDYLAAAQGLCGVYEDGTTCVDEGFQQPQSAILQWTGEDPVQADGSIDEQTRLFGEILELKPHSQQTRAFNQNSLDVRTYALRLPAGSVSSWSTLSVRDSRGQTAQLLLASSVTEGIISFPLKLRRTEGLTTIDEIVEEDHGEEKVLYVIDSTSNQIATISLFLNDPIGNVQLRGYSDGPVYDSLGRLYSRLKWTNATTFPEYVLKGIRRTTVQNFSDGSLQFHISRNLPNTNLICGAVTLQEGFQWQKEKYASLCNEMLFQVDSSDEFHEGCSALILNNGTLSMNTTTCNKTNIQYKVQLSARKIPAGTENITCIASSDSCSLFELELLDINHAPVFTTHPVMDVSQSWSKQTISFANNLSAGSRLEDRKQHLFFDFNFSNPDLFAIPPKLSVKADCPTSNMCGEVTFVLKEGSFGNSTFRVILYDDGGSLYLRDYQIGSDKSNVSFFTLHIPGLGKSPSFTLMQEPLVIFQGSDPVVVQNAVKNVAIWRDGKPDINQFSFMYNSSLENVFLQTPTLSTDGTLRFQLRNDVIGLVHLDFIIHDQVSNILGNKQTFVVQVLGRNMPPTFVLAPFWHNLEQPTNQSFDITISSISAGTYLEDFSQNVSFKFFSEANCNLFYQQPQILVQSQHEAVLRVFLLAHSTGECKFWLFAFDDGGAERGGRNLSDASPLSILLIPRNDPPSFVAPPVIFVIEGSSKQEFPGFVSSLSPGPGLDEAQQLVTCSVQQDSSSLFDLAPMLLLNSNLVLSVKSGVVGEIGLVVVCEDNGGSEFGGRNRTTRDTTLFVIARPSISDVSPLLWISSQLPPSAATFTVTGQNFSPQVPSQLVAPASSQQAAVVVLIGGLPCLSTIIVSDTTLVCRGVQSFGERGWVQVRISESLVGMTRGALLPDLYVLHISLIAAGLSDSGRGFAFMHPTAQGIISMLDLDLQADRSVRAISAIGDTIFFGGNFRKLRNQTFSHAAMWAGKKLLPLGRGLDGFVNGFLNYRETLIVYGSFSEAVQADNKVQEVGEKLLAPGAAAWDLVRSVWLPVPGQNLPLGAITSGYSLQLQQGDWRMFLAGRLRSADAIEYGGLVELDEAAMVWRALCGASGVCGVQGGDAFALLATRPACFNCPVQLFVGGDFVSAGGLRSSSFLALWNGLDWEAIGVLDGPVFALAGYGLGVFVGGSFSQLNGQLVNGIAQYQSGTWTSVGGGVRGSVYSLGTTVNCVFMGGDFDAVGEEVVVNETRNVDFSQIDRYGQSIRNIVRWCSKDKMFEAVRTAQDGILGKVLAMHV
mmetsp:Transcript_11353/g.25820  ORF Transcript_11353/g.25820 Transcript_11353/m.25820 type:complete len:2059 (-) Transcript_11353:494-6670(-)